MSTLPNAYRFSDARHWRAGTLSGLAIARDGSLTAIERLQLLPDAITAAVPTFTPAANPAGGVLWRSARDEIQRLDDFDHVCGAAPGNELLVSSPRWVADRNALWAFTAEQVLRFDGETLHLDEQFDVQSRHGCVRDIAVDGRQGLWILSSQGEQQHLLHLDCRGCVVAALAIDAATMTSITTVPDAARIVALTENGQALHFFDTTGVVARAPLFADALGAGLVIMVIAGNGRDRLLIAGRLPESDVMQLWVLDADGHRIDGPLAIVRPDMQQAAPVVSGMTGAGATVWLATDLGLLRFTARGASTAGSHGYFITPALTSPERDLRRGWLRAELEVVLPAGAVLEARYFNTSDTDLQAELVAAFADPAVSPQARRRLLEQRLGSPPEQRFVFTPETAPVANPEGSNAPLAVPLFGTRDRFLWLEIAVMSAPGSAPVRIGELRVLYPEVSLMESLPAIYRVQRDTGDTLRSLVGVLEATTQQIDARISAFVQLLNPLTAPVAWLDFVARWLDLPWDDSLPVEAKRRVLSAAADLLGERGTRRGLQRLLDCLFGTGAARLIDVTADAGVMRLNAGARLPALLAGAALDAPVLAEKTVLGRARLSCGSDAADPLAGLAGLVLLSIRAEPELRAQLEPLLQGLLEQYVPAAVQLRVRWSRERRDVHTLDAGWILDSRGTARLGKTSELGRDALGGKLAIRLSDPGGSLRLQL